MHPIATDPNRVYFDAWLAQADAAEPAQRPFEELLAEHFLMATVITAMEREAEQMLRGGSLRLAFWRDLVDFNGNFVHLCHRVKEEQQLLPALREHGLLDAQQHDAVHHEHASAKRLTLDLCDGVSTGDWERALRLVSIYAHILRPHMRREEAGAFASAAHALPAAGEAKLRSGFTEVQKAALARGGRRHYVEVARRLAATAGLAVDF